MKTTWRRKCVNRIRIWTLTSAIVMIHSGQSQYCKTSPEYNTKDWNQKILQWPLRNDTVEGDTRTFSSHRMLDGQKTQIQFVHFHVNSPLNQTVSSATPTKLKIPSTDPRRKKMIRCVGAAILYERSMVQFLNCASVNLDSVLLKISQNQFSFAFDHEI